MLDSVVNIKRGNNSHSVFLLYNHLILVIKYCRKYTVATPGRVLDLIQQKYINLSQVEHFVVDEAVMMLDMGMLYNVKKIISYLPSKRQTLCFSVTMPKEIEILANTILHRSVKVTIKPVATTVDTIVQSGYNVNNLP